MQPGPGSGRSPGQLHAGVARVIDEGMHPPRYRRGVTPGQRPSVEQELLRRAGGRLPQGDAEVVARAARRHRGAGGVAGGGGGAGAVPGEAASWSCRARGSARSRPGRSGSRSTSRSSRARGDRVDLRVGADVVAARRRSAVRDRHRQLRLHAGGWPGTGVEVDLPTSARACRPGRRSPPRPWRRPRRRCPPHPSPLR